MRTFIALLVTVSSLAFAQTEPPKQQPKPKAQRLTFGDQDVDGKRVSPLSSYVNVKGKRKFDSLIKERVDFNDKLASSVDAL